MALIGGVAFTTLALLWVLRPFRNDGTHVTTGSGQLPDSPALAAQVAGTAGPAVPYVDFQAGNYPPSHFTNAFGAQDTLRGETSIRPHRTLRKGAGPQGKERLDWLAH